MNGSLPRPSPKNADFKYFWPRFLAAVCFLLTRPPPLTLPSPCLPPRLHRTYSCQNSTLKHVRLTLCPEPGRRHAGARRLSWQLLATCAWPVATNPRLASVEVPFCAEHVAARVSSHNHRPL